jgi:protein-S-isoprenylcysteine O-methyltransferase Ste14
MSFTRRHREQTEQDSTASDEPRQASRGNMLPGRQGRRFAVERVLVRLVATAGIVGVGVLLGAVLGSSNVQGWIMGLVVAIVSVVLSALLWSSRQL